MKIKELLLELREPIDRNYYGAWINANTKQLHPILKQGGHIEFIEKHLREWNIPKEYIKSAAHYYAIGYANNLVRATFRPRDDIKFEGMAGDLHKIARIILASAVQHDVRVVSVSKFHDLEDTGHSNFRVFTVPNDIATLKTFLGIK